MALCCAVSGTAQALQPLAKFVAAAKVHNPDSQVSLAQRAAAKAQADGALGRALPSLSIQGSYTRNQYQVEIPEKLLLPTAPPSAVLVISPSDQLDAQGTLAVPLVSLSSFRNISAARARSEAAAHQFEATQLQVESQVVQSYYQLVADMALVSASKRALDVSSQSQKVTETRVSLGQAPPLERDRAEAEVQRQVEQLAAAKLQQAIAAQHLGSISGITPNTSTPVTLTDNLNPAPPLETFEPPEAGTPAEAASRDALVAARRQAQAARMQWVPSLAGSVTEHASNYSGFSGHDFSLQAMVGLRWSADYALFASVRAADAQADVAKAQVEKSTLATRDAIADSWHAVGAALARARASQAQVTAADHAEKLAAVRYQAGDSTQLDLLSAQRDAFSAEVSRIQANADLANARAQLQIAAGRDPFASKNGETP